jgi:hypothetical protein
MQVRTRHERSGGSFSTLRPQGRAINAALALLLGLLLACSSALAAPATGPAEKPRIAFFPLGGGSSDEIRAKVGFSLRTKLDRTGTYEVIDGPRMAELAADAKDPITFDTKPEVVQELAKSENVQVIIWGETNPANKGFMVRVKLLDLREPQPQPRTVAKTIAEPTDLRFVSEEILQTLPGVKAFEHPNEEAVAHDADAEKLWATNPNLVVNGDFAEPGHWECIYMAERYPITIGDKMPAVDKVSVIRLPAEGDNKAANALAMNISKTCAENNGMACLSEPIKIAPGTRYRISFRYKSDGPRLHVFIKGYTMAEDIKGKQTEREIYRRQVPPTAGTNGEWVTIVDELNPQHVAFPVQTLRVDLYAYLTPGTVLFEDVVLKAVGKPTRDAHDEAIKKPLKPTTRP